jgi:hypothetical protein
MAPKKMKRSTDQNIYMQQGDRYTERPANNQAKPIGNKKIKNSLCFR